MKALLRGPIGRGLANRALATAALLAGTASLGLASEAVAQDDDAMQVLAVVHRVFQGMQAADSAQVRSSFAEGARFASVTEGGMDGPIGYTPIDGWIDAVGGSGGRWDERIYDLAVTVDEYIASVWAPYTFYLDGRMEHCGVNSIELLRTRDGWKITQLSDTRRTQGCPDIAPAASDR